MYHRFSDTMKNTIKAPRISLTKGIKIIQMPPFWITFFYTLKNISKSRKKKWD
jgi:hypothetical protein